MEKLEKQELNKPQRDAKGRLLPGNTANPNGRPKGKTLKEWVREQLQNMPEEERKPFYVYVDEFQNFATPDFAQILSEARKFGMSLEFHTKKLLKDYILHQVHMQYLS